MSYPEMFFVSFGDTSWVLTDGSTGRPVMGAGPSCKYYGSREEAQTDIDRLAVDVDGGHFKIHSTHEQDNSCADAGADD